jgi:hypothetical protein
MNTFESIHPQPDSFHSHNHAEASETFKIFQQQVREYLSDISARISEYVVPGETSTVYPDFTESDLAVLNVEDMYQWKAITQLEERITDVNIPFDPQKKDIQMITITRDFERYQEALLSADQSDPVIKSRFGECEFVSICRRVRDRACFLSCRRWQGFSPPRGYV